MKKVIIALSLGGLTACGGGETSLTPFSSFSTLPENGQTSIEGEALTASYTANLQSGAVDVGAISGPNNATAVLTTENGFLTGISVSASGSSINIDTNNGDALVAEYPLIVGVNAEGTDLLLSADPEALGMEYQNFGVWLTGYNTGSGTAGVGTFGASTDSAVVAGKQETATYDGFSTGLLQDVDGQPYLTASDIYIETDFSTAVIVSSGTVGVNLNDESDLPVPSDFDFSGAGTVSGDGFTADITGTYVDGTTDGTFYGPNAEEVGGTFSSTYGGSTYVGSYGAIDLP